MSSKRKRKKKQTKMTTWYDEMRKHYQWTEAVPLLTLTAGQRAEVVILDDEPSLVHDRYGLRIRLRVLYNNTEHVLLTKAKSLCDALWKLQRKHGSLRNLKVIIQKPDRERGILRWRVVEAGE